jgi:hypothetical protein
MFGSLLGLFRGASTAAPAERAPAPTAAAPPDLLTDADRDKLAGVHPDLVRVVRAARARTPFRVTEGLRSSQRP